MASETIPEWTYHINYGPNDEADWANLITPEGEHVANIRTRHAVRIVSALNAQADVATWRSTVNDPPVAQGALARFFDNELGDWVYTVFDPGPLSLSMAGPYSEWLPLDTFKRPLYLSPSRADGLREALQAVVDEVRNVASASYIREPVLAKAIAALASTPAEGMVLDADGFEPHDFEYVHGLLTVAADDEVFLRAALSNNLNVILAALDRAAHQASAVGVKALEWEANAADTPFGHYAIDPYGRTFGVYHNDILCTGEPTTIEAAKVAAQADYEARIRSALSPVPVSDSRHSV